MRPFVRLFVASSLLVHCVASSGSAFAQERRDQAAAEALFEAGRQAVEKGDFKTACGRFEESNRLDPAVGTAFNLANCREKLGELKRAWELFTQVRDTVDSSDERYSIAKARADALSERLPRLTIQVTGEAPTGTTVTVDKVELRRASFGIPLPLDSGEHEVVVRAPGRSDYRQVVRLRERERKTVEVEAGPLLAFKPTTKPGQPDKPRPPDESFTHAGRLGVFVRSDVDGKFRGAVAAGGLSFGVGDHVEPALAALIGRDKGFEPSASFFLLKDELKPRLSLGVPVFFVDGARPGGRASLGVMWDPTARVGVFLDVGVAYFFDLPDDYDKLVFLPSAGVAARL